MREENNKLNHLLMWPQDKRTTKNTILILHQRRQFYQVHVEAVRYTLNFEIFFLVCFVTVSRIENKAFHMWDSTLPQGYIPSSTPTSTPDTFVFYICGYVCV